MNKQLENKLSSREVSEMMEIQHKDLLKKIDSINVDFRERKIAFSKYWQESTYKVEGQLRDYREFQITKRGCEFLAHKTTGTKGNLFTDKYMDKFAMMEQAIRTGSYNPTGITKAEILAIIKDLPNDRLKNELSMQLMSLIPVEQKHLPVSNFTLEQVENILNELLMTKTDVIIAQTKYGLAINKTKLYRHFEKYGIKWTESLRLLDEYGFIYHKEGCRTVQIKVEDIKNPVRVVMIKE